MADATRRRVLAAIEELGFVRNETARRLRQCPRDTHAVGVLLEDLANPYFADVARGAEAALSGQGANVLWCTSGYSADKERRCLEFLAEQRVAGILISPVDVDHGRLSRLRARGVTVVVIDRRVAAPVACSARVDHVAGGDIATDRLLELGRNRLAFVTGQAFSDPIRARYDGAARALTRAGGGQLITLAEETMTATAGRQAARRLLELNAMPSGVFCANDLLAIGVVSELHRQGVKVPEEIAVVGYDDIELAATAAVPLTTVRQPRQELGRAAAELALLEGAEHGDHAHRSIVLTPELVIRDSA